MNNTEFYNDLCLLISAILHNSLLNFHLDDMKTYEYRNTISNLIIANVLFNCFVNLLLVAYDSIRNIAKYIKKRGMRKEWKESLKRLN